MKISKLLKLLFDPSDNGLNGDAPHISTEMAEARKRHWRKYAADSAANGIPIETVLSHLKVSIDKLKTDGFSYYEPLKSKEELELTGLERDLLLIEEHPDVYIKREEDNPSHEYTDTVRALQAEKTRLEGNIQQTQAQIIKLQDYI